MKETLPPQEDVAAWSDAGSDEDEDEAEDVPAASTPTTEAMGRVVRGVDNIAETVAGFAKESTILSSLAKNLVFDSGDGDALEPDDDTSKTVKPGHRGLDSSGSSRSVLGRQPLSSLQHKPHSPRVKSLIGGSDVE